MDEQYIKFKRTVLKETKLFPPLACVGLELTRFELGGNDGTFGSLHIVFSIQIKAYIFHF